MSKIEELRKIRKDIAKDYNSSAIKKTEIEKLCDKTKDIQTLIVKDIILEAKDVKSFILVPKKGYELYPFKAGQYLSVVVDIDGRKTTRAYSISSSVNDARKGFYRITIKRVKDGLVSNYFLDKVSVGDELEVSRPVGNFGYHKIRDEKNVIAIAGGSGITPFMSLAKSILEGDENCNLTVFYSVQKEEDIIFKDEILSINKKNKNSKKGKVRFLITTTREEKEGYHKGYIDENMISEYLEEFNTVLMCGPKSLYKAMNELLTKFNIPRKNVHYENFFASCSETDAKTYDLRILDKGEAKVIPCRSDETLLVSMEKSGLFAPSLCRVGECGYCRSILIEGKIKTVGAMVAKGLAKNDYIHPCVTYPLSNVVICLDN